MSKNYSYALENKHVYLSKLQDGDILFEGDKIVVLSELSAFTVVGTAKIINEGDGFKECPEMWSNHYASGDGKYIAGMYGICIDDMNDNTIQELSKDKQSKETLPSFMYMIADDYVPSKEYPEKFITYEVPANTWAVFPCRGPMPTAMQGVYQKIFKEWLPENTDYELAGMYNIEYYTDSSKYEKGNQD